MRRVILDQFENLSCQITQFFKRGKHMKTEVFQYENDLATEQIFSYVIM